MILNINIISPRHLVLWGLIFTVNNPMFFFFNIFERERELVHEPRRGRERETQNLKQALGSELPAQSPPNAGLGPANREIMTRAKVRRLTD